MAEVRMEKMTANGSVRLKTGFGHAAIAVFQLEGESALRCAERFLTLRGTQPLSERLENKVYYGFWNHSLSSEIDSAFGDQGESNPDSLTEDVVFCRTSSASAQLHTHSSPAVIDSVLRAFSSNGVDVLEFEKSQGNFGPKKNLLSWLNLQDLDWASGDSPFRSFTELETAFGDWLRGIGVPKQCSPTSAQLETHFSTAMQLMLEAKTNPIGAVFANHLNGSLLRFLTSGFVAFAPVRDSDSVAKGEWIRKVSAVLASADRVVSLNQPTDILFFGQPNVGKSSLINGVVGFDRAIVSSTAGTTRDLIHQETVIGGLPFRIFDSAGIRETENEIEEQGIRRASDAIEKTQNAFLIVQPSSLSFESAQWLSSRDLELVEGYRDRFGKELPVVLNKVDLLPPGQLAKVQERNPDWILVSATQKQGLQQLVECLKSCSGVDWSDVERYQSAPLSAEMKSYFQKILAYFSS